MHIQALWIAFLLIFHKRTVPMWNSQKNVCVCVCLAINFSREYETCSRDTSYTEQLQQQTTRSSATTNSNGNSNNNKKNP